MIPESLGQLKNHGKKPPAKLYDFSPPRIVLPMLSQPVNFEPQTNGHPVFKWVAECLYRHSESGRYYALVKRGGKQHRKSLKTTDRQLAERKLSAFRDKIGRSVTATRDRNTTFKELAQEWFDVAKTRLKPRSADSAECCLKHDQRIDGWLHTPWLHHFAQA